MRNVGGIAQTEAQKSSDLFMKCRYLDEITGGRGIIFATGTPISNSMVELYTIQRYLQMNALQEQGLQHFDAVMSDYFARRFPFEDNTKKAAEFKDAKDAFVVYALRKYADDNEVKICVVSADSGIRGSISGDTRFVAFNRSVDLFGCYITGMLEEAVAENTRIVQKFTEEVRGEIADKIVDEINNSGAWVSEAEDYTCG